MSTKCNYIQLPQCRAPKASMRGFQSKAGGETVKKWWDTVKTVNKNKMQ